MSSFLRSPLTTGERSLPPLIYRFGRRLGRLTDEERTQVVRGFIERVRWIQAGR